MTKVVRQGIADVLHDDVATNPRMAHAAEDIRRTLDGQLGSMRTQVQTLLAQ